MLDASGSDVEALRRGARAARAAEGVLATREGLEPRAQVYAVCLPLEDLAFGLDTGRPRYVASAQAALARLTAAHVP